jgi:hypothetical protein
MRKRRETDEEKINELLRGSNPGIPDPPATEYSSNCELEILTTLVLVAMIKASGYV